MAKLRTYVHVKDDKGHNHVFGPPDDVPAWAQALITNPKAWAEAPIVERLTESEPTPSAKPAAKRAPRRKAAPGGSVQS